MSGDKGGARGGGACGSADRQAKSNAVWPAANACAAVSRSPVSLATSITHPGCPALLLRSWTPVTVALAFKTYTTHGIDAPQEQQIFIVSSMTVRKQHTQSQSCNSSHDCCWWPAPSDACGAEPAGRAHASLLAAHPPGHPNRRQTTAPGCPPFVCLQSVIIFTVVLGAFTSGFVGRLLGSDDMTPGNTMPTTLPSLDPDDLK